MPGSSNDRWAGLTPRALAAGLSCYLTVGMVQNMGSADLGLLLFSLLAVSDAMAEQVATLPSDAPDRESPSAEVSLDARRG